MSKEYVEKVEALPQAKEMDDVVALFHKITGAYPNAILYGSNIAAEAAQGMTLIAAGTTTTNEWMEKMFGVKGHHNKDSLARVMLVAMVKSVCDEMGWSVKKFMKEMKEVLDRAKKEGVI